MELLFLLILLIPVVIVILVISVIVLSSSLSQQKQIVENLSQKVQQHTKKFEQLEKNKALLLAETTTVQSVFEQAKQAKEPINEEKPEYNISLEEKIEKEQPKKEAVVFKEAEESAPEVHSFSPPPLTKIASHSSEPSYSLTDLLHKIGLTPPESGSGSSMAWWSTRIGIVLGVIAAIFLGLYVNQDTGPLVRWCQLLFFSLGVCTGGFFLEKKLPSFGRTLTAGGLGLVFVTAYACYGLPAMKITDSALIGSLAQIVAIGLICGWALYRKSENIFSLSLVLGYVTCAFTLIQGITTLPYLALISLSVLGSLLYAVKAWQSGLIIPLLGSGIGFIAYTLVDFPSQLGWVVIASTAVLMVWNITCLGWRMKSESKPVWMKPHWISTVWILVAVMMTKIAGLDLSVIYLLFAILCVAVGIVWYRLFDSVSIRNTFWTKASILLALFIVTALEGPVRSFALRSQVGTLAFLAKREKSKLFEILAGVAFVVALTVAKIDLTKIEVTEYWISNDWFLMVFSVAAIALLLWHAVIYRRSDNPIISDSETNREIFHSIAFATLGLQLVQTGAYSVSGSWSFLLPLAIGVVVGVVALFLRIKNALIVSLITLAGTGIIQLIQSPSALMGWQCLVWMLCCWGVLLVGCYLKPNNNLNSRKPAGIIAAILLAFSGIHYAIFAYEVLGLEGSLGLWMLGLALLWQSLKGFVKLPHLEMLSILPASVAILLNTSVFHQTSSLSLWLSLLGLLLYQLIGWRRWSLLKKNPLSVVMKVMCQVSMFSRMFFVLAGTCQLLLMFSMKYEMSTGILTILTALIGVAVIISSRYLKESAWHWMGAFLLVIAGLLTLEGEGVMGAATLSLIYLSYLGIGIYLSRQTTTTTLLNKPKVASTLFGSASILLVMTTLANAPSWSELTTAAWVLAGVGLVLSGFIANLRGYRFIGLITLAFAIIRLFTYDIQDSLWRIIGFGLTSALFVGLGYLYNRYYKRLANGDLDWGKESE